jgi:hypothetical protein
VIPVPIPNELVWEGAQRRTIAPPNHDFTHPHISPVEALLDLDPTTGSPRFSMLIELEDGDLERLGADKRFWLHILGQQLQPFALTLLDESEKVKALVQDLLSKVEAGDEESLPVEAVGVVETARLLLHSASKSEEVVQLYARALKGALELYDRKFKPPKERTSA